jgi:transcriptional regulator with XRE-family HTH domain
MNPYVTGTMIRRLREERKMTQLQLAGKIGVTDTACSA